MLKIGLMALAIGLAMRALLTPAGIAVHFVIGVLIGFALPAVLVGAYQQRRARMHPSNRP